MSLLRPLRPLTSPITTSPHSKQLRHLFLPRHASTTTTTQQPPKPRVLEKPARFNPPSHGSRLPRRHTPKAYPGAPLTSEQKTRRYPHMMPAEGTWMFSFLTNRMLHVWITMSVLISLVLAVQIGDFLHTTPYAHLLPPNSMLLSHPFAFFSRYSEVYMMHVDYTSQQTAERRRQKVEDVRKRSEYRKAHGLEGDETTFGGWTAKSDAEVMGTGMRESGQVGGTVEMGGKADASPDTYVDFEGNRQPARKKWFGIW